MLQQINGFSNSMPLTLKGARRIDRETQKITLYQVVNYNPATDEMMPQSDATSVHDDAYDAYSEARLDDHGKSGVIMIDIEPFYGRCSSRDVTREFEAEFLRVCEAREIELT